MTEIQRNHPHRPHIADREVILAQDYDGQTALLAHAESQSGPSVLIII